MTSQSVRMDAIIVHLSSIDKKLVIPYILTKNEFLSEEHLSLLSPLLVWSWTIFIEVHGLVKCSVFRYCKVSIHPPNIDNVLFYMQYRDIDIEAQYQEINTDTFSFQYFSVLL